MRAHFKVLSVMLAAAEKAFTVTRDEFEEKLGDSIQQYRMSVHMWNIRKTVRSLGGDYDSCVTSIGSGRKVIGYKLSPEAAALFASKIPSQQMLMITDQRERPAVESMIEAFRRLTNTSSAASV